VQFCERFILRELFCSGHTIGMDQRSCYSLVYEMRAVAGFF
jgi:hypothetical protein